jgi:O-6-methylguanine DNA methyltransferase
MNPHGRSDRIKQALAGVSPFQRRVFQALLRVPSGCVTTYGALAATIGCGSARAVGQALRRNPLAPDIPCHRAIRSDLMLGGFKGSCAVDSRGGRVRLGQQAHTQGLPVDGGVDNEPH